MDVKWQNKQNKSHPEEVYLNLIQAWENKVFNSGKFPGLEYDLSAGDGNLYFKVNPDKAEELRDLAQSFEAKFKEESEITIPQFIKDHPKEFPFKERAEHMITGKKTRGTQDDISEKLAHAGVTTDTRWQLLKERKNLTIKGKLNYRNKWVLDVFQQKIWENILENGDYKNKQELFEPKDLSEIYELLDKIRGELPRVTFTDADLREITGLHHISSKEWYQLVKNLTYVKLDGKAKLAYDPKIKRAREVQFLNYQVFQITRNAIVEGYSSRSKAPQYRYYIDTNIFALLTYHNLLAHRFIKFPKQFYKLKGREQELFRKIAPFSEVQRNIKWIMEIMGYKTPHSNLTQVRKYIKQALNNLKEAGLITRWTNSGKGYDTAYRIHRAKFRNIEYRTRNRTQRKAKPIPKKSENDLSRLKAMIAKEKAKSKR